MVLHVPELIVLQEQSNVILQHLDTLNDAMSRWHYKGMDVGFSYFASDIDYQKFLKQKDKRKKKDIYLTNRMPYFCS